MRKMESEINKLIDEYQQRIEIMDVRIKNISDVIRENRRRGIVSDINRAERSGLFASRQSMVQAQADISSLLDYVDLQG